MTDQVEVEIVTPKYCNFCSEEGVEKVAEYDYKTVFGPWANGCKSHYYMYRCYTELGTGKGQKLVLITVEEEE